MKNIEQKIKKVSLVDKSYKLLFMIYAPVALLTFSLKFFSGAEESYIFLAAVAFVCVSFVLSPLILYLYVTNKDSVHKDREQHIPFMLRHQFLVYLIAVSSIAGAILMFYVYRSYDISEGQMMPTAGYSERIVLIAGIKDTLGNHIDGFDNLSSGIKKYIEESPEKTKNYQISYIDHHNTYNDSILEEIKGYESIGAKYFICVSTEPCHEIAEKLMELNKENTKPNIRFIITAASMLDIETRKGYIYNFSMNANDEAQLLAAKAFEDGKRKIGYIASDSKYGRDVIHAFENAWQAFQDVEGLQGVYIDPNLSANIAQKRLEESLITQQKFDAILIATNGRGLEMLNTDAKLKSLKIYSFSDSTSFLISKLNDKKRLSSLRPRFRERDPELLKPTMALSYLTLSKVVHAIEKSDALHSAFDDVWLETDYPALVEFKNDKEANFKIELEVYTQGDNPI